MITFIKDLLRIKELRAAEKENKILKKSIKELEDAFLVPGKAEIYEQSLDVN